MANEAAKADYKALHPEAQEWHSGDFTGWQGKRVNRETGWRGYHASWGLSHYAATVDVDPGDNFTRVTNAQPAALRPAPEPESEVDRGRTS